MQPPLKSRFRSFNSITTIGGPTVVLRLNENREKAKNEASFRFP